MGDDGETKTEEVGHRERCRGLLFIQKIKESQMQDPELEKVVEHLADRPDFRMVDEVLSDLCFQWNCISIFASFVWF